MSAFLGIYSKSNKLDLIKTEAAVADFSSGNSRTASLHPYPGMLFCFVSGFESSFHKQEDSLAFVSGHISFENTLYQNSSLPEAQKFDQFLHNPEQESLEKLEGAFAAIRYETKNHTLHLCNDKFGVFPLFVFENNEYIVFSNEYQPLAAFHPNAKVLDYNAIAQFFTLGITLGNRTLYEQIRNLHPASCYTAKGKITELKTYWSAKNIELSTKDDDTLAEEMHALFTHINREYMDAGLTNICLLSAGADSRLIIATLRPEQRKRITFYTSNLSFLDRTQDKDVIGADLLSKRFNLQQRVEKISFYENQFGPGFFDTEREIRESLVYGGWHGGEFLGGYCYRAAPITRALTYKEINQKLKSVFSWRFRFRLSVHPFKAYEEEKGKLSGANSDLLFMINQLTRGFFTSVYSGSRGHWLQPYQLTNHGFSPFWDSRFLKKLLEIPPEKLKNYSLYNKVFSHCDKAFTEIGSNSPLTNREDSIMPKIDTGLEPKNQLPNTHHAAYVDCISNENIRKRKFYKTDFLKKTLRNESDEISKQWLDFEVWYARYLKQLG